MPVIMERIMKGEKLSRRWFLGGSLATLVVSGCSTTRIKKTTMARSGCRSPNEKLNLAGIGVGGKGSSDVDTCNSENIVALCDVDWNNAAGTFRRYPNAKKFHDLRRMLDECPEIDAVTISTADHMHAIAAMRCMERGKHVYVQKPLTHTAHEARVLRKTAHRYGVATQMGNQCAKCIRGRTAPRGGGRKASLARCRSSRFRSTSIGISGSARRRSGRTTKAIARSSGAAGGNSAAARWATSPATASAR